MKKILHTTAAVAVCCAALALTSGCAKITVLRTQEISAVKTHIDSLHAENAAYQVRLLEEQNKILTEQNRRLMAELQTSIEALRQIRAEQRVRFSEIDNKVSAVKTNVDESQSKLVNLNRQTAEVGRRIEQQMAAQEEAAAQRQLQLEGLFDIAMGDFNAGRFDLAMNGFHDLIKQLPAEDTVMVPEAEYWIAESFYAKGSNDEAEKAYMEFIRNRTSSKRYCVALYKLGLTYERQSKPKSREMVWNNLLERCADTQEAQAVRAAQGQ